MMLTEALYLIGSGFMASTLTRAHLDSSDIEVNAMDIEVSGQALPLTY